MNKTYAFLALLAVIAFFAIGLQTVGVVKPSVATTTVVANVGRDASEGFETFVNSKGGQQAMISAGALVVLLFGWFCIGNIIENKTASNTIGMVYLVVVLAAWAYMLLQMG